MLILERGDFVRQEPQNWDVGEVAVRRRYDAGETWLDGEGRPFIPRAYYNVGGATKFFGGSALRFRPSDFAARELEGGATAAWPYGYGELEPWYAKAESSPRRPWEGRRGPDGGSPRRLPSPSPGARAGHRGNRREARVSGPPSLPPAGCGRPGPEGPLREGQPLRRLPLQGARQGRRGEPHPSPPASQEGALAGAAHVMPRREPRDGRRGRAHRRGAGSTGRRGLQGRGWSLCRGRGCGELCRSPPPLGERAAAGGAFELQRARRAPLHGAQQHGRHGPLALAPESNRLPEDPCPPRLLHQRGAGRSGPRRRAVPRQGQARDAAGTRGSNPPPARGPHRRRGASTSG